MKLITRIVFFIFFCGYFTFVFAENKTKSETLDSVAAVVNSGVITSSELQKQLDLFKKQANPQSMADEKSFRKQVLDQMINRKLQLEIAAQSGIKAKDEDVDNAVKMIANQNHVDVKTIFEKVKEQGFSIADYKKQLREEVILQQLAHQQFAGKINVSKQEVDDFMRSAAWKSFNTKEYHLQDILIALPEVPNPQDIIDAKNHAESVIEKLKRGMSFQDAAMSESSSTAALQGGDLGWRKLPEIPPNFSDQLVHLKVDGIMGPILTSNGFHIVKLAGIRSTVPKDLIAQQKQVEQLIMQRKFEEAMQNWVTKLRSEAYVSVNEA